MQLWGIPGTLAQPLAPAGLRIRDTAGAKEADCRTPASHPEQVEPRAMIHELMQESPQLAERCRDFSADRGLDSGKTKALLWDDYRIRPLIDTRALWREERQAPDYDPSQPITDH